MIIISIVSLLISLLLQGLMSNFLGYTISNLSIFTTMYVLVNLVVLQSYFEDDRKFLILVIVFGLLVDVTYSNTGIMAACLFMLIFYFNKLLSFFIPYNAVTINLFSVLSVFLYNIVTFLLLLVLKFDSFDILVLFKVLCCNILMTVIYTNIIYHSISWLYKKFNLKIVRNSLKFR